MTYNNDKNFLFSADKKLIAENSESCKFESHKSDFFYLNWSSQYYAAVKSEFTCESDLFIHELIKYSIFFFWHSMHLSHLALSGPTRKPNPTRPEPGQDPASGAHGLKSIPGGLVGS